MEQSLAGRKGLWAARTARNGQSEPGGAESNTSVVEDLVGAGSAAVAEGPDAQDPPMCGTPLLLLL